MATDYQHAGWWARPAAILYFLTVGLVVGVFVIVLGTILGVLGTILRLMGSEAGGYSSDSQTRRPISGPINSTFTWWFALLHYSATGRGEFKLFPDFLGDVA